MVWKVMIGISGIGVLTLFLLEEVEMKAQTDAKFGLNEKETNVSVSKVAAQA